jgi:hypothetical protein
MDDKSQSVSAAGWREVPGARPDTFERRADQQPYVAAAQVLPAPKQVPRVVKVQVLRTSEDAPQSAVVKVRKEKQGSRHVTVQVRSSEQETETAEARCGSLRVPRTKTVRVMDRHRRCRL